MENLAIPYIGCFLIAIWFLVIGCVAWWLDKRSPGFVSGEDAYYQALHEYTQENPGWPQGQE